jgi:Mce-associated membrane protein
VSEKDDEVVTDDVDSDEVDSTEVEPEPRPEAEIEEEPQSAPVTPQRRRIGRLLVPVALAILLLGSAGLASWIYTSQFRPDRETSAAAAGDTIKAASDGAVALLSYAPESMDKDFANAKSHLTGGFLDYYSQFTHDIVTPAVQQKAVKTSATIVQSAVSDLQPDSAVVLVFLNQSTTSKENPNGSFTASSVKVGLTKVNGTWLISAFDPV